MKFNNRGHTNVMQPSGKPNRLYGLPKVHKGIKEGKKIPPCMPIVSNSGSNNEMLSGQKSSIICTRLT